MKASWLAILCALAVGVPACDSKPKDDKASKEDDKKDDKKDEKGDKKDEKGDKADKKDEKGDKADKADKKPAAMAADDDPAPPPAPTEKPKAPMTKEQVDTFLKDESAKMTTDAYESLLLGVADCSVEKHGIDYDCQGYKNFSAGQKKKNEEYKKTNAVALKHIRHPSAAVRYQATSPAQSAAFGYDAADDGAKLYLDALRSEQDKYVLAHMVSVYSGARKSEKVRKVVFRMVDHADARVRESALRTLSEPEVAKEVKGFYDKFLEKVEGDSDDRVKAQACEGLAAAGDAGAIKVYEKILTGSGPNEVKEGCFEGLIQSWIDIPYPKKPSKEGYELTLKMLEKTDRTEKFPPWRGISKLGWAKTEFKSSYDSGKDWYAAAKEFYDKARLVKALNALILDDKAGSIARDSAINCLQRLGEGKLLETVAADLKKQSGSDAKRLAESAEKASKEKNEY